MTTKQKVGTWCDILPALNSHNPLNMQSHDKLKTYLHYTIAMVTKIVKMVTYSEEFPPINSNDPLMRWSCDVRWQIKYSSICRISMDSKLGKVLTYHEKLPPLKPQDPLIMWPTWGHVIVWKIKISTFTRLMTTEIGRLLTLGAGSSRKHVNT